MVRRGEFGNAGAQTGDRVVVRLIWVFGLAPIVFPAAVLASVVAIHRTTELPSSPATRIALLGKHRGGAAGADLEPAAAIPSKLELRALSSAQLGARVMRASLGAAHQGDAIPGSTPIRTPVLASAAKPSRPATLSVSQMGWVMKHLGSVKVLNGLRLGSGSLVVSLAGVRPLAASATCRRLDGVVESCLARAKSRLEVLVKGRPVSCEVFRAAGPDGKVGRCKAGDIDLATDLIQNGLAKRG